MKDPHYMPRTGWKPLMAVAKWPILGVELEVEMDVCGEEDEDCNCWRCRDNEREVPNEVREIDSILENKYKDWLITKEDNSLRVGGIELVSIPMTFAQHRKNWPPVLDFLKKERAECNTRTGLHIHIETPELPPIRTNSVLLNNRSFIEKIAGRKENEYCDWPYSDATLIDRKHYGVVNLTEHVPRIDPNHSVYEFRAPQATTDLKEFLGRVQLPIALADFILTTDEKPNKFEAFVNKYSYINALL
jgi:hypothetical protein